jgi:hypothetical protein
MLSEGKSIYSLFYSTEATATHKDPSNIALNALDRAPRVPFPTRLVALWPRSASFAQRESTRVPLEATGANPAHPEHLPISKAFLDAKVVRRKLLRCYPNINQSCNENLNSQPTIVAI